MQEKLPNPTLAHIPDDSVEHLSTHLSIPVEEPRMSLRSVGVVVASCLAYFSNQYAINAVGVHLWALGSALGDYMDVIWFINGASLVVVATGPAIAYHANFKSRKWIILTGLVFGVIGQVISGVAHGMHSLIIGQALVGVTLATQPLLVTIPAEVLAQDKRWFAQLATNFAGGLGGFVGALGGGAILKSHLVAGDSLTWQWIFRVGACLYCVTLILLAITYRPRPLQVCVNVRQAKPKFDWTGSFLLPLGLVPLMTGLTFGGEPSPWNGLQVLITLAVGGTCIILFVIWEIWGTSTGLFHHQMLTHSRNFPITLILFFIEGIHFVVFIVWYNQEVYAVYQPDPLFQGLRFTVFYTSVTLLAPFIAAYCARTKSVKPALTVGNAFVVVAAALMATANLHSGKFFILYAALAGIGLAAPLVILMTAAHLCAPTDLIHAVAPLATLVRTIGIVTGNVLSYLVINTQFNTSLPQKLSTALQPLGVTSDQVPALTDALRSRDPGILDFLGRNRAFSSQVLQTAKQVSLEAQLSAFRFVWVAVAGLAGLAMVACLSMSPVHNQVISGSGSDSPNNRTYLVDTPRSTPRRSVEHGIEAFRDEKGTGFSDASHDA